QPQQQPLESSADPGEWFHFGQRQRYQVDDETHQVQGNEPTHDAVSGGDDTFACAVVVVVCVCGGGHERGLLRVAAVQASAPMTAELTARQNQVVGLRGVRMCGSSMNMAAKGANPATIPNAAEMSSPMMLRRVGSLSLTRARRPSFWGVVCGRWGELGGGGSFTRSSWCGGGCVGAGGERPHDRARTRSPSRSGRWRCRGELAGV